MDDLLLAGANLLLNVNNPSFPTSPAKSTSGSASSSRPGSSPENESYYNGDGSRSSSSSCSNSSANAGNDSGFTGNHNLSHNSETKDSEVSLTANGSYASSSGSRLHSAKDRGDPNKTSNHFANKKLEARGSSIGNGPVSVSAICAPSGLSLQGSVDGHSFQSASQRHRHDVQAAFHLNTGCSMNGGSGSGMSKATGGDLDRASGTPAPSERSSAAVSDRSNEKSFGTSGGSTNGKCSSSSSSSSSSSNRGAADAMDRLSIKTERNSSSGGRSKTSSSGSGRGSRSNTRNETFSSSNGCSSGGSNGGTSSNAGSNSDSPDAASSSSQATVESSSKKSGSTKKRSPPNDFDKELIAKFRKESHSALEQRRRDKINDGINQLKELVEPYHNGKYDKASVLRKSIEYIQQAQHLQRRLVEENYALREDNGQLQTCLDVIRTENRLLRIEITKLRPDLQHLRAEDEEGPLSKSHIEALAAAKMEGLYGHKADVHPKTDAVFGGAKVNGVYGSAKLDGMYGAVGKMDGLLAGVSVGLGKTDGLVAVSGLAGHTGGAASSSPLISASLPPLKKVHVDEWKRSTDRFHLST